MSGFTNIQMAIGGGPPPPPNSVLVVLAQVAPGGTTDEAIRTSFNGGASWLSPNTPLPGQGFVGGAYSESRQEALLLTNDGTILRTTDMISFANLPNDLGSHNLTDIIRVESLGLYIACAIAGIDTTHRIATSPTGEVWTWQDSVVNRNWVRLGYNPVTGVVLCGGNNFNVQPFIQSTDAVNWSLPAGSYAGGRSCYEFAFSTAGRYFFGDRGSVDPSHSNDLVTFVIDDNLGSGSTMACYDPLHDLVVVGTGGTGIFTSPATGAVSYTNRASTIHFQQCEDMIWQGSFSQLVGIRPITGGETDVQLITSSNGTAYVASIPGFPATSAWGRIFEAFVPA